MNGCHKGIMALDQLTKTNTLTKHYANAAQLDYPTTLIDSTTNSISPHNQHLAAQPASCRTST